jgi:predicted 3-demethylubiquinone-9 3-methyltransferase (glyoxalase superfamily)
MHKITPFLWFDNQAEQAANFYVSLFENSKIDSVTHYGDAGPGPAGSVMTVAFQLEGQEFVALNGGPIFKFTEAISFVVNCKTQAEVDGLWAKLIEGGEEGQCGWLKDKFGLSWQIVPEGFNDYLSGSDAKKSQKAMQAMLQMKKLDIDQLRLAYEQG